MKKITLVFALLLTVAFSFTYGQNILFEDDFNDEDISDWTLYDEDGDGQEWTAVQIQDTNGNPVGTPVARSFSWNSTTGPLTPDNWIVSPAIDLSGLPASSTVTLRWDIQAADATWAAENYTVYVANSNTVSALSASSTFVNEVVDQVGGAGMFVTRTLDISSFVGESTVYLAWRHHNVTDQFSIELDNVEVDSDMTASIAGKNVPEWMNYFVSQDILSVTSENALNQLDIYNLSGQKVISMNIEDQQQVQADLNGLSSGLYLVEVTGEGGQATFKIGL